MDPIRQLKERGCKIIDGDVFDISGRLKVYDPYLVLVYEPKKKEYQVWSTDKYLSFVTMFPELDARILERVRRADGRTSYGLKAKLDELKAQKDYDEKKERLDAYNVAQDVKRELVGLDVGRKTFAL